MVPGEDQHVGWLVVPDEIEVLADGIRRAPVPIEARPLLGRDILQKVTDLFTENIPPVLQMLGQGLGLVLGQDDDLVDLGVDAVAQGEIHETVDPAEGDRRLGPVPGQGHEPLAPAPGHDECEDFFHLLLPETPAPLLPRAAFLS